MRVWLQLTHLFGLPEGHRPDNLMQAALGPVLRAACQDIVDAPLPEPITRLVQELALRERATQSQDRPSSQPLTYRLRPLGQPRRVRRMARAPAGRSTIPIASRKVSYSRLATTTLMISALESSANQVLVLSPTTPKASKDPAGPDVSMKFGRLGGFVRPMTRSVRLVCARYS